MDWKTILIAAVAAVVLIIVLNKTGLASKVGLSHFESDPTI